MIGSAAGSYDEVRLALERIKGPHELAGATAIIAAWWGDAPEQIKDQMTGRGIDMLRARIAAALAAAWYEGYEAGRG